MLPILILFVVSALSLAAQSTASRETVSLDGTWKIADSVSANAQPTVYDHSVPVPGLAHSATPPFKNVDEFQSRQLLSNLVDQGMYSQADFDKLGNSKGISHQQRNYFWYRRTFIAPPQRAVALLKVNKAQFGIVVFMNGVSLGEHDPCFTSAEKHDILQLKFVRADGGTATATQVPFQMEALGADSYLMTIDAPEQPGKYTLEAVAAASDNAGNPTLSRRWITVVDAAAKH